MDDIETIFSENERNEIIQWDKNCMAMVLSLYLWALLEDPNNHKERPLTCNLELNINCAQQQNLVYDKRNIKKEKIYIDNLADPIKYKSAPLYYDLKPDIAAVMQRELITRTKQMISKTQQLVDPLMHLMETLSCNLEPDIMVR